MITRIPVLVCLTLAAAGGVAGRMGNITLPPVSTFRNACARCHGYEGSAYGKGFGNLGPDSLRSVTEDMMFGPAGLDPDSIDVDAMAAYNASLEKSVPFASVLNGMSFLDGKDPVLTLDVSPGAVVTVNDSTVGIEASGSVWKIRYDPGKMSSIVFTIVRGSRQSSLRFPEQMWVQ